MANKELDLSGFSYLASARVLRIKEYPKPNYGAEVLDVIDTLAADAPMVAVAASHLGLKVGLIVNSVGTDRESDQTVSYLERNNVTTTLGRKSEIKSPFIIVLSDNVGKREWFPYLPMVVSELESVNLDLMAKSSVAYIDFYDLIRKPAQRAVEFANKNKIPSFVNLGGSPFTPEVSNFLRGKDIAILQTNLDESEAQNAPTLAQSIYSSAKPEIAIVTLGREGAVAHTKDGAVAVPAHEVKIRHLHGAGAAFSAGYAYCYLKGLGIEESLHFSCALGSLNCTVERGFDEFSVQEIERFLKGSI